MVYETEHRVVLAALDIKADVAFVADKLQRKQTNTFDDFLCNISQHIVYRLHCAVPFLICDLAHLFLMIFFKNDLTYSTTTVLGKVAKLLLNGENALIKGSRRTSLKLFSLPEFYLMHVLL